MPELIAAKAIVDAGQTYQLPSLDIRDSFDVRTSLATETTAHKMAVLEIIDGECLPFESVIGVEIDLSDYICHPVTLTDRETGEELAAVRCILIAEDGQCISTCSPYVLQSMSRIGWAKGGMPPWDPPIKVKLVQQSTRDKRRVFKLRAVKA